MYSSNSASVVRHSPPIFRPGISLPIILYIVSRLLNLSSLIKSSTVRSVCMESCYHPSQWRTGDGVIEYLQGRQSCRWRRLHLPPSIQPLPQHAHHVSQILAFQLMHVSGRHAGEAVTPDPTFGEGV